LHCGAYHTVALRDDNTVLAFGDNQKGQSSVPTDLGSVRVVRAGHEHTVALLHDGSIRAWGSNRFFELTQPSGMLAPGERIRAVHAGGERTIVEIARIDPDLNGDGAVGGADLAIMLGAWGSCPGSWCAADLNGDGIVGGADLATLLSAWAP